MNYKQQMQACFDQVHYRELDVRYQPEQRAVWCYLRPASRPCCTEDLLAELGHFCRFVEHYAKLDAGDSKQDGLRFLVLASRAPGVFSLGGDLALFLRLIRAGDDAGLFHYVKSCIDVLYAYYHLPVTTISLVQGDALGGGLEGALMSRVLIAERHAQMGLPEILFNLFPGMGAYSLIARRLDPSRAERLILSGRTYSATELHEMGIVDVLAENGQGEEAVLSYIKKHDRARNGYDAIHKVRQIYHPLGYDELMRIGTLWVDTALRLGERDLRIMERIAQSQEKLAAFQPPAQIKQLA